ncbi:DUF2087 domain-containing protein [Paenibacillus harenae]|uniref:DUF2087 domain-containing protein n=1 Tax=Paenibacillus harenae TaxID=306543 RepID=UPI0003F60704
MGVSERFWASSIVELKQGYAYDAEGGLYYCLICGETFEDGEVFRHEQSGRWYEAGTYAAYHLQLAHGSMLEFLLELDKRATGLTDLQKELIGGFAAALSDSEMMERTGIGSASTIRNHRFVLKEKAKQAKLLLTILELMEQGAAAVPQFVPIHRTATQVDERYALTKDEYDSLMKQYFPNGPDGPLASFPRKAKRKIAVLRHISSNFQKGVRYTEKEVNELLSRFWEEDYVLLRRYLIEYGYLDRKDDGSEYWVKDTAGAYEPERSAESIQAAPTALTVKEQTKKGKRKLKQEPKKVVEQERRDAQKMDKTKRKQLTSEYQERERKMGVYRIKNDINGKIYIGGSTNLEPLWGKEQFQLNMDGHRNRELQKEWKQYGGENFSFLILETVKFDHQVLYDYKDVSAVEGRQPADMVRQYNREVAELTEKWIEKLQPYGDKGYNRPGGEGKQ